MFSVLFSFHVENKNVLLFSNCCFNTHPCFVVSFEELSLVWEVLLEILLADALQLRTPVWVIVTFCFCWRLLFIKNKLSPARGSGPQQEINVSNMC